MVDQNFELRLIEALQPIRGFAQAQGVYHLFHSGLFDRITGPISIDDLAKGLELRPDRVAGLLRFLANEDLVSLDEDTVTLTTRATELREFRPWYELLVGGYARSFQQITEILADGYATRDDAMVGTGSCGISRYDALPLVRRLLTDLPIKPTGITDIGCGDGSFLTELARDFPDVPALGVDPYAPLAESTGPVTFEQSSAVAHLRSVDAATTTRRLFVAAFLLQEILEQEGRGVVIEIVRHAVSNGSCLAVVEVDHRPADPAVMRHGLGLTSYNAYYLLHELTEQRLEAREFWSTPSPRPARPWSPSTPWIRGSTRQDWNSAAC